MIHQSLEFNNTQSLFFLRIGNEIHSSIYHTDTSISRILESDRHDQCLSWSHEDVLDELHTDTFESTIRHIEIGGRVDIAQCCREVHREDSISTCGIFFQCRNGSCTRVDTIIWIEVTSSGKTRERSRLKCIRCWYHICSRIIGDEIRCSRSTRRWDIVSDPPRIGNSINLIVVGYIGIGGSSSHCSTGSVRWVVHTETLYSTIVADSEDPQLLSGREPLLENSARRDEYLTILRAIGRRDTDILEWSSRNSNIRAVIKDAWSHETCSRAVPFWEIIPRTIDRIEYATPIGDTTIANTEPWSSIDISTLNIEHIRARSHCRLSDGNLPSTSIDPVPNIELIREGSRHGLNRISDQDIAGPCSDTTSCISP